MAAGQVRAAVAVLAEQLRDRGAEIEQAGELPPDVVTALRQAGVFRLWMPVELGGYEAAPIEVLEVVQLLSAADGSTGWCAATGVGSNIAGALLAEPVARRLFADPDVLCGGVLMPGGRAVPQLDGSYLVDGRWGFGSGTQHCDWVIGAAQVVEDPAPDGAPPNRLLAVLMPASAVKFLPTWQVIGLAGTGSVDYEVSGLQVPAELCIDLARLSPWPAGGMWRIPLRSLLYPMLAAVPLGIARRALEELLSQGDRHRYGFRQAGWPTGRRCRQWWAGCRPWSRPAAATWAAPCSGCPRWPTADRCPRRPIGRRPGQPPSTPPSSPSRRSLCVIRPPVRWRCTGPIRCNERCGMCSPQLSTSR